MKEDTLPTSFLPAERSDTCEIKNVKDKLQNDVLITKILDCVPVISLMLNGYRQVVLFNRAATSITQIKDVEDIFGMRPGELIGCVHAEESGGGCGTTEFCRVCGAANAILSAQSGIADIKECHINKVNGEAMDLRVWTSPLEVNNETYTFFCVIDITDEKRRRWLERIFYHDIMNSVSAVITSAEIIKEASPLDKDKMAGVILVAGNRIVNEISAQKEISAAESGDLVIKYEPVDSQKVLRDVVSLYEKSEYAKGKNIIISSKSQSVKFLSDQRLLTRVLGNMLKNALEATDSGDVIKLSSTKSGNKVKFMVNNPGALSEEVRLQIFQRSFSTKAGDRGLGTYSMKLLSERYLKGKVSFTSDKKGITFYAVYPLNPVQ